MVKGKIVVRGELKSVFKEWLKMQDGIFTDDVIVCNGDVDNCSTCVCVSTMDTQCVVDDIDPKDARVMFILLNPDMSGYSNAEEFITMQHVKHKEGHPLIIDEENKRGVYTADIEVWLVRTKKAILHTLIENLM